MGADRSPLRHGKPATGSRVVRAGHMSRILSIQDEAMHHKFMASVEVYHELFVEPLEQRIAYLEAWPWVKLWIQLKRLVAWVMGFFMEPVPEDEADEAEVKEGAEAPEQEPEAETTSDRRASAGMDLAPGEPKDG